MRIVLIGTRNGRRTIRWAQCLGLSLALSTVIGIGTWGVFRLLSGRWAHFPVLWGALMGVGLVAQAMIRGLCLPPGELTELD